MITIGIRAEPKKVTFAIFDSEKNKIKNLEEIVIPTTFSLPEQLKFLRNTLLDIAREYGVEAAGVRIAESSSQNQSNERLYLEAVAMESFASSTIKSYYAGRKTGICSRLEITTKLFDEIVGGRDPFADVKGWPSNKSVVSREAILIAMAACA
ncbi:hypothetical protein [Pseudomonas sp. Q1-7]|uniref:hypothetical protein n=1 Tax=Pseudomonas sp. Q1-7 TaxID=3020843 RepID=UPI0023010A4B|nr:hypothetical protein [Pseudomonas sp. Q1-7]